jgi:hypothetical protein
VVGWWAGGWGFRLPQAVLHQAGHRFLGSWDCIAFSPCGVWKEPSEAPADGVSSDGCCVLLDTPPWVCLVSAARLQCVSLLQWVRIFIVRLYIGMEGRQGRQGGREKGRRNLYIPYHATCRLRTHPRNDAGAAAGLVIHEHLWAGNQRRHIALRCGMTVCERV